MRTGLFPPLGLTYLANPLIKEGYRVKIIDASSFQYTEPQILDMARQLKPDLISIYSVVPSTDEPYSIAIFFKKLNFKNTLLIYGGPHNNCFPELLFENIKDLDLLAYGEGKIAFQEAVKFYEKQGKLPQKLPEVPV